MADTQVDITDFERIVVHHHPAFTDEEQKRRKQEEILYYMLKVIREASDGKAH